jgi:murein DD-endopeptidase MepM/ murein hydrolase activator NlpD
MHTGMDISAGWGVPIRAAGAGRVIQSGYNGGYGNSITIDHGNTLSTLYGHCSSLAVSQGQFVKKGQLIGYVGSTGASTGPHLHFEVMVNGIQVDPSGYLNGQDPLDSAHK